MKIGKAITPNSAICTANEHAIVVRGTDLCDDLIGTANFGDYFYFLLTGKPADKAVSAVLNACLVAIAEHGLVPSVQAARMTMAAAPDALQGAVAAGILGCGSVILGASETAGKMFVEIDTVTQRNGGDMAAAAHAVVTARRARKECAHVNSGRRRERRMPSALEHVLKAQERAHVGGGGRVGVLGEELSLQREEVQLRGPRRCRVRRERTPL